MKKSFKCNIPNYVVTPTLKASLIGFSFKVEASILDPELRSVFTVEEEAYELNINQNDAQIEAKTYVGFVRALETFLQSIQCPRHKVKGCEIPNLPITIKD
jgi:N-acetyl-beta-hexosaminidase